MSRLTRSQPQLWADLLTNLGGSGSSLTMSEEELIAAARNTYGGGTVSALTSSRSELIASLVVASGGSASALIHNEDEMLASLATALGASNWSAATKSAVESLAESVTLSDGEGGGGEPAWFPENALFSMNLPEAGAFDSVTGTLTVEDQMSGNGLGGWGGDFEYQMSGLGPTGYTFADGKDIAYSGELADHVLAGKTIRMVMKRGASDAQRAHVISDEEGNFNVVLEFRTFGPNGGPMADGSDDVRIEAWTLGSLSSVVNYFGPALAVGETFAIAMTITPTRFEFSFNGNTPVSLVMDATDWPSDPPMTIAFMDAQDGDVLIEMTAYDTLPDASGLAALSIP